MKKKLFLLKILMLLLVLMFVPLTVSAHSVELDPDSNIVLPMFIYNGSGNISIYNIDQEYTLYYQAIEMDADVASQIDEIYDTSNSELEALESELDTLKTECDELEEIYNTVNEEYQSRLEADESDPELPELESKVEEARTNYQNKATEYDDKAKEYNAKVDEAEAQVTELTPTYDDENWIESTDESFKIDLSTFSDERKFVVWVKVETSDGNSIYDENIYTLNGTMTSTGDNDNNNDNNNTTNDNQNNDNDDKNTSNLPSGNSGNTAPGSLPFAGSSLAIILGIIILAIFIIVSYKKYNKYKGIK